MNAPVLMPVCGACGLIAPRRAEACASCSAPLGARAMAAPRLDARGFWVAVRCTFQCRSCSFAAPLDLLDVDGSVECAYCGLRQRFEPSAWNEALAFAHAVGDLAGPEPEGRHPDAGVWIGPKNPHRELGESLTFSELSISGVGMVEGMTVPRSLQMKAGPGFPVCRRCKVPVLLDVSPDGRTKTTCTVCARTSLYELPPAARPYARALVAVVAEEHRVDQKRAGGTADGSSVSAVACPSCGAPLALRGGDRTVECKFCGAFCRVPGRFLVRSGQERIEPEIWWMLFAGPSAKRGELESGSGLDAAPLEAPSLGRGLDPRQWAIHLAFLFVALWLGFEVAAIDGLRPLSPAVTPPAKASVKVRR